MEGTDGLGGGKKAEELGLILEGSAVLVSSVWCADSGTNGDCKVHVGE